MRDGQGPAASFYFPVAVATDGAGILYVADSGNNVIRKITPGGRRDLVDHIKARNVHVASAVDGNALRIGRGSEGSDYCTAGNAYVADVDNATIRKITPGGLVTTIVARPGPHSA
jgi:hypothetical protein